MRCYFHSLSNVETYPSFCIYTHSIIELKMIREFEDQMDIEDAWKAKNEPGEPVACEDLKKELDL